MQRWTALAAAIILLPTGSALPRDYGYINPPEIRDWFRSLRRPDLPASRRDRSCCDVSDCHRTEFTLKDGHYRARLGRIVGNVTPPVWELTEWVDVPDDRVIKDQGNPLGEAVICHGEITSDPEINRLAPHIYCFVPGNLS